MKINPYNCTGITKMSQLENDMSFAKAITWKTKYLDLTDELIIGPYSYINLINLKKVWLPKDIKFINAETPSKAPFVGSNKDAVIFTDIISENSIPETWSEYWNYANLEVRYNSTKLDYEYYQNNK